MRDPRLLLWLAAVAVPLLTACAVWLFVRRRRRVAGALGDRALARRLTGVDLGAVPWGRVSLVLGGAVALGAALADPRWGEVPETLRTRGAPLVAVVDVSSSMLARDGLPDRLTAARMALRAVARENPDRPIGIVAFAGQAVALSPPTLDRTAFELFVEALHPEMATQTGSLLVPALRQGLALLAAERGGVLLVISDGDTAEDVPAAVDLARAAGRAGIPIFTAGTGSVIGAPVPDIDFRSGRQVGYKLERSGETAISRLNEELLQAIARASGGEYLGIRSPAATEALAVRVAGATARGRGDEGDPREPRFAWFAALALVLLTGETLIRQPWLRRVGPTAAAVFLVLAAGCRPAPYVGADPEAADRLIEEFQEEVRRDPSSLRARYNLGTALLLYGRFTDSRGYLEAATSATDSTLRQHAWYNAGNADLSPVFEGVATEPREGMLRRAIASYKDALLLDPADRDAKWNLELARRLLDEPPPPPPPDPTPDAGDGGGGGGGDAGTADPLPQTAAPGGAPQMSPQAADRLLSGAQQRELVTQQEKLTRPQPRDPFAH